MAEPATRRMTLDEFLSWDDGTDTRYELWGGIVVAMAPPMARHGRLALALGGELRAALRPRPPCGAFSKAGIALPDRNDTFYVADIAVTCEALRAEDRLISNPVLIVEVLSPSTAATDRQIKIPDYRRIPSVQEVLARRGAGQRRAASPSDGEHLLRLQDRRRYDGHAENVGRPAHAECGLRLRHRRRRLGRLHAGAPPD
jgi:Uma2 family endonuclease